MKLEDYKARAARDLLFEEIDTGVFRNIITGKIVRRGDTNEEAYL